VFKIFGKIEYNNHRSLKRWQFILQLTGAAFAAAGGGGGNQRLAAAGGGVGYAINGANGGQGVWPRIRQIAHSSTAAVFTS